MNTFIHREAQPEVNVKLAHPTLNVASFREYCALTSGCASRYIEGFYKYTLSHTTHELCVSVKWPLSLSAQELYTNNNTCTVEPLSMDTSYKGHNRKTLHIKDKFNGPKCITLYL